MKIHQSDYEELQEEAAIAFAESGADRELDSNREQMEFDFISNQIGTDDWEVIPDLMVTTSFEEFVYTARWKTGSVNIIRNCLTTYHNLTEFDLHRLQSQHEIDHGASYSENNNRFYVRNRVVQMQLSRAQYQTYKMLKENQTCSN